MVAKATSQNESLDQTCTKKKYKETDLVPFNSKNPRQKLFVDEFYGNKTPLIILNGYAGVGKTFIAMHAALSMVLDSSTHYERIFIIRSAVESGAAQGFLKGTLDEKNEPYELPYKLICRTIFKEPHDGHYAKLKADGKIEFLSTTYLRGITVENAILIVEESQNMDYTELKTIATRVGEGTRVIMTCDGAQNDLERKKKESGMPSFMRVIDNMKSGFSKTIKFELSDVVRSDFCAAFLVSEYDLSNPESIE